VARHPGYADAWAMLAYVYLDEDRNGYNMRGTVEDARQRALDAAEAAVAADPNSDIANEALMIVLDRRGDLEGSERAGRTAIAINPNNPALRVELGLRLFQRGRWDEGAAMVRQALAESVVVPRLSRITLVFDHYRKSEYEEALREVHLMDMPDFYATHMLCAAIHGQLEQREEASRALAELLRLRPNFAAEMRDDFRARHFTEPFIDMMAEGLRKAGLPVE
jgi:adenylate cyclase